MEGLLETYNNNNNNNILLTSINGEYYIHIYILSQIITDNHKYKYKIIKMIKMLLSQFEVKVYFYHSNQLIIHVQYLQHHQSQV